MSELLFAAVTPALMTALFGTAVACVALIAAAVVTWDERHAPWLLAGATLYLVGTVVLTIAYHVPRNDALAAVDPHGVDAAGRWTRYVSEWTAGNHVRGAAALAAAGLLTVALSLG